MPQSFLSTIRRGLAVGFLLSSSLLVAAEATPFSAQIDAVALDDSDVVGILERARQIVAGPIVQRVYSLDEMTNTATRRTANTRNKAKGVEDRIGAKLAEQFALASADMGNARQMLEELPLIAGAWRLTREEPLKVYLEKQLNEIVTWEPFQRPGWTLSARSDPLPARGDGVWLATGTLLQALSITLEVIPDNSLSPALLQAVRARMREEVLLTLHDWQNKIPWYVVSKKANSNQWVVPASGMLIGAATLGREDLRPAYDLGVASLQQSLALAGDDGSLNEGFVYGMSWTSFSLLLANHFMEVKGDESFAENGFFKSFPNWMALYLQPGGNVVNAFDAFSGQRGSLSLALTDLTRVAAVSGSAPLVRALRHEAGRLREDFFGLLAIGVLKNAPDDALPPLAGLFQRSRMFVWRSSWNNDASGLWVRGGDAADFHDHYDRGHVNFVVSGTPVLIEAGTPGYSDPTKRHDYDSAMGHNTLVVDDNIFPEKAPADIVVSSESPDGGSLLVDLDKAYPSLNDVKREVTWTTTTLLVKDSLVAPKVVQPTWRWHLASAEEPVVTQVDAQHFHVRVPAGRISFPPWVGPWSDPDRPKPENVDVLATAEVEIELFASQPITVSTVRQSDHTLKFRRAGNQHLVLVISSAEKTSSLTVTTKFRVTPVSK